MDFTQSPPRPLTTLELPLVKLSMPKQGASPYNTSANDQAWNHYSTDTPSSRLMVRIEKGSVNNVYSSSQYAGDSRGNSPRPVCKITIWSGTTCYYSMDVAEYGRQWNHPKAEFRILGIKTKGNGLLLKALSPLSQLSYSMSQESFAPSQVFSRVQMRFQSIQDLQTLVETLKEFCPGIDTPPRGQHQPGEASMSQSQARSEMRPYAAEDLDSMNTNHHQQHESQMLEESDSQQAGQGYSQLGDLDMDGFRVPASPPKQTFPRSQPGGQSTTPSRPLMTETSPGRRDDQLPTPDHSVFRRTTFEPVTSVSTAESAFVTPNSSARRTGGNNSENTPHLIDLSTPCPTRQGASVESSTHGMLDSKNRDGEKSGIQRVQEEHSSRKRKLNNALETSMEFDTGIDRDALIVEVRSKTGLYSLEADDLESVVASVVCEEGFVDFVKTMESMWRARAKVDIDLEA